MLDKMGQTRLQPIARRKKNAGFTLIEVVAVTAMLGVLAAMLMPSIEGANVKAKNAKLKSDLAVVDNAIQVYKMENGKCPPSLEDLVPEYVAKNKGFKDAANGAFTYQGSDLTYTLTGVNAQGETVASDGSSGGASNEPKQDSAG